MWRDFPCRFFVSSNKHRYHKTMKQEILKSIGSRLMEDARAYMIGQERPHNPTNYNQTTAFVAVCDAMEDVDNLLGWS